MTSLADALGIAAADVPAAAPAPPADVCCAPAPVVDEPFVDPAAGSPAAA